MSEFGNMGNDKPGKGDKPGGGDNLFGAQDQSVGQKRPRDDPLDDPLVIAVTDALLEQTVLPDSIPAEVTVTTREDQDPMSQLTNYDSSDEEEAHEKAEDEDDDESAATSRSAKSNDSNLSIASTKSINTLAESVVSRLSSNSFTMVPSGGDLLEEFNRFWDENQHFGQFAVLVAFISLAYSKGIDGAKITDFFTSRSSGLNLRDGGAGVAAIIRDAVAPVKAAGGASPTLLSRISNGITSGISAIATAVVTVIGTNLVVQEPLTIDNVTTLLSEVGTTMVEVSGTVPEFISRLAVKVAALKALYKIRQMERGAIGQSEAARIQSAINEAADLVNRASAADRAGTSLTVVALRTQVNAIIETLNPGAGPGAKKGGKRQSQKKQQKQQKQKKQKKTQKQSHKKLSKSKRAKKAKQSKKANKKH